MQKNFSNGIWKPPQYKWLSIVFKDGKLYRYSQQALHILNFKLGLGSLKTEQEPCWRHFIPQNLWPWLFKVPKLKQLKKPCKFSEYYKRRYRLSEQIKAFIFKTININKERFECPICNYLGPFLDINPEWGFRKNAKCNFLRP